jgi:hypothetical protein
VANACCSMWAVLRSARRFSRTTPSTSPRGRRASRAGARARASCSPSRRRRSARAPAPAARRPAPGRSGTRRHSRLRSRSRPGVVARRAAPFASSPKTVADARVGENAGVPAYTVNEDALRSRGRARVSPPKPTESPMRSSSLLNRAAPSHHVDRPLAADELLQPNQLARGEAGDDPRVATLAQRGRQLSRRALR